jgi:hypothetical protein
MHRGVAEKDTALRGYLVSQARSRLMNNESRIRGFSSWQAHEGWRTRVKKVFVEAARANRDEVLHDLLTGCRWTPC